MKLRVLGCSAAELPNAKLSSFLVDEHLLLDAGTIGQALDEKKQWKIRYVLITHAHLDHIKDIPFLADNISVQNRKHQVTVISIHHVIRAIKNNLLNDTVWPDFTKIPRLGNPIIKLQTIKTGTPFRVDGYTVTAFRVNHAVPSIGYLVENAGGKTLLYTGDTGPTEHIWKAVERKKIDTLIIETSLPNKYRRAAITAGHLTPKLLEAEIGKMTNIPEKILITHCKPAYKNTVTQELKRLNVKNVTLLRDGDVFEC